LSQDQHCVLVEWYTARYHGRHACSDGLVGGFIARLESQHHQWNVQAERQGILFELLLNNSWISDLPRQDFAEHVNLQQLAIGLGRLGLGEHVVDT